MELLLLIDQSHPLALCVMMTKSSRTGMYQQHSALCNSCLCVCFKRDDDDGLVIHSNQGGFNKFTIIHT
jgi:hypothetical protein